MTREEATKIIKDYEVNGCGYCHQGGDEVEEAFKMAIKALEQEPCEELYRLIIDSNSLMLLENYKTGERTVIEKKSEPCEDAISRQAVLAIAGDSCLDLNSYEDTKEFCDEIKELPPVTPKSKTDVLDKIRAEIKEESKFCPLTEGLERALEIIDKYTKERSDKE
jgi:hypothetical protein